MTIGDDSVTNTTTRQNIINRYMRYVDIFPSKEFTIQIPLISLAGDSFFKKVLNISSFNDNLNNNFNVPSLPVGNAVLAGVYTSLYYKNSLFFVNYEVIGVEQSIGKTAYTKLTLKELIIKP